MNCSRIIDQWHDYYCNLSWPRPNKVVSDIAITWPLGQVSVTDTLGKYLESFYAKGKPANALQTVMDGIATPLC
jgi:hypothetical protein